MQYGTPGDVYRSQVFPARLAPLPLLKRGDRAVIAVRVWLCRDDYVSHLGGGISMPPELGTRIPMQRAFDLQSKERQRSNLAFLLTAMPCTFLALVFIVCYRRQPQHAEYAWYAGMLLGRALFDFMWYGIFALGAYHGVGLLAGIAYPVNLGCSYFFFRGYFRVPGPRWFLWVLAACLLLQVPDGGGWVDWVTSAESNTLLGAGQLPVIAANVWLLIQQGRKKNSEAWVLGVPYLIYISGFVGRITMFLFRFNGIFGYDDFLANGLLLLEEPIAIPMELAGLMLGSLAMAGILLNRFTRIALRGERLNKELEAARQVQELLLPAASIEVPGFAVESAYWPASEVGGDFYQVLPCKEGGMIVVAGDVSGKGLKAAMLVSVVIGILRTEKSSSPARILLVLNEGLSGHTGGGFVTCCCARFDADGTVTLANAGHPAPYCDGLEVELEAGLPLGIDPEAEYAEFTKTGRSFTFVSDGVVEAENAKRELFGFERTREVSGHPATEIAEAARAWGQNDDITVVTVQRRSNELL